MMNMVLSYQSCMPMNRAPLCPLSTLKSRTKKTNNLCFSTPLLFGPKMSSITRSSSSSSSSSSLLASTHPLLMIPPYENEEDGRGLCSFYDYANKKDVNTNIKIPEEVKHATCVGSSHGWLAYISHRDCSVFLWNPFTTSPLIYLPPIHTLPPITVIPHEELYEEESADVLEIVGIGDTCKSAFEYDDDFSPDFWFKVEWDYPSTQRCFYTMSPKRLSLHYISKIILSSTPTSDDCIAVALARGTSICCSIAFCKPGDKSWTFVEPPLLKKYLPIRDVIHFKDQLFYAVPVCETRLFAYDLADLASPKSYLVEASYELVRHRLLYFNVHDEATTKLCDVRHYLVESLGDLLWVRRLVSHKMNGDDEFICFGDVTYPTETITFDVFRLDFSQNTWECTECIGDQVLFLGTNQSLSLSARDFPSLKPNCIYFTDDFSGLREGHDYGHYELGETVFGEFGKFGDGKVLPPPFWVMRHFQ